MTNLPIDVQSSGVITVNGTSIELGDYGATLRVSCPISLRIRLAGTAPRIAEPLLGCGKAGKAIEISIRALGHHSL